MRNILISQAQIKKIEHTILSMNSLKLHSIVSFLCLLCFISTELKGQNDSLNSSNISTLEISVKSGVFLNATGLEKFLSHRIPRDITIEKNNTSSFSWGGGLKLLSKNSKNKMSRIYFNLGYLINSYSYNNIETSIQSPYTVKEISTTLKYAQHDLNITLGIRKYIDDVGKKFRKYYELEGGLNLPFAYSIVINSSLFMEDNYSEETYSKNYEYNKYVSFSEYSDDFNERITIIGTIPLNITISAGAEIQSIFKNIVILEIGTHLNGRYYSHRNESQYTKIDFTPFIKFGMNVFQN